MSGYDALLRHLFFRESNGPKKSLFIVTALHGGSAYSLLLLGPAEDDAALKVVLVAALRSVRLPGDE